MPRAGRSQISTSSLARASKRRWKTSRLPPLEDDAQGLVQRDIAFHDLLYQLADHDLLIRAWQENIAGKLRILLNVSQRTLSALADAERQHRRLLEPILEGDDARARRLLEEHIDEAAARARQGLWGSQDGAQSTVEGSQP